MLCQLLPKQRKLTQDWKVTLISSSDIFFFFLAAGGCFIYSFLMPLPAFELRLPEKEHPNGMPIRRYPKKGGSALGTAASSPITHVSKSKVPFSSILPSLKPSNPEVQLGHRTNSSNIAWVFSQLCGRHILGKRSRSDRDHSVKGCSASPTLRCHHP